MSAAVIFNRENMPDGLKDDLQYLKEGMYAHPLGQRTYLNNTY